MRADSPHPIILAPQCTGFNSHLTKVHYNGLSGAPAFRVRANSFVVGRNWAVICFLFAVLCLIFRAEKAWREEGGRADRQGKKERESYTCDDTYEAVVCEGLGA